MALSNAGHPLKLQSGLPPKIGNLSKHLITRVIHCRPRETLFTEIVWAWETGS